MVKSQWCKPAQWASTHLPRRDAKVDQLRPLRRAEQRQHGVGQFGIGVGGDGHEDATVLRVISLGFGYGSIPINTIFRGMNIHLPAILMFTRGTRF